MMSNYKAFEMEADSINWGLLGQVAQTKHTKTVDCHYEYGTAGFRTRADLLDSVVYRMGALAVVRSMVTKSSIGVMITASHNPAPDNGIKLVDPQGEMLDSSWEPLATELANANDSDVTKLIHTIMNDKEADVCHKAVILLARDTRDSGPHLVECFKTGVTVMGGKCIDYDILTTPQLHYMVKCRNSLCEYGLDTEEGYYKKFSSAFSALWALKEDLNDNYNVCVNVDAANGVGACKVNQMKDYLGKTLQISVFNDGAGVLNYRCGADYVKVQQVGPDGLSAHGFDRCLSFDGDADRIVYYYIDDGGQFHLLDGDKIASLMARYMKHLLDESRLDLSMGVVQTAYANGSSTVYIEQTLNVPVACVKTGVKNLHPRAIQYDIGIYFEANGHGTALFSDRAIRSINTALSSATGTLKMAVHKLSLYMDMINQTVGDAISDMLAVEVVLHEYGWSIVDWDSQYTDLPNRQLKVKVADRSVIETTDAERITTCPTGLQEAINSTVTSYSNARSFVRPSGTEDIVRVYAEAMTQDDADCLAYQVATHVYELAGGVGGKPEYSEPH